MVELLQRNALTSATKEIVKDYEKKKLQITKATG